MVNTILIIEDDEAIREILSYSLKNEGFNIIEASTGKEGLEIIEDMKVDLIILDIMLPDTSGFEVCKKISVVNKIPIVMLTARNNIMDKVVGLEIGADDYITKPFDIREVIARIKVCLRRVQQPASLKDEKVIELKGNIKIFKERHEVFIGSELVNLKPREYELLIILAENKGRVLSRNRLIEDVWGFDFEGQSRTVDVHIQRLRKKLKCDKENHIIKTVFGVGYKMT